MNVFIGNKYLCEKKYNLECCRVLQAAKVEAGEEILAGLPVLLLHHVVAVQILGKLVEHVGGEIPLEHHLHPAGPHIAEQQSERYTTRRRSYSAAWLASVFCPASGLMSVTVSGTGYPD